MNIERLAEIAQAILEDFGETQPVEQIGKVNSALDLVMQSPSESSEISLNEALKAFNVSMDKSELDEFPATWRPYIEELGITEIFGESLKRRVESVVSGRGIVQAKAKEELQEIQSELTEYQQKFKMLVDVADKFDFKVRHVEEEMAEVSFLFPSDQFDGRMVDFAKEIKFMNDAVLFFSELGTGSRENPTMYQLSNPDPLIVVGISILAATQMLKFVKALMEVIGETYHLRKLREDAKAAKANRKTFEAIEENIQEQIAKGVTDASEALFRDCKVTDKGRREELKNEAKIILLKLADKIDRGFRIDADAGLPPEPENEDDPEDKDAVENREMIIEFVELAKQIRYSKTPDDPVLNLPQFEDDDGEETEADDDTEPPPED